MKNGLATETQRHREQQEEVLVRNVPSAAVPKGRPRFFAHRPRESKPAPLVRQTQTQARRGALAVSLSNGDPPRFLCRAPTGRHSIAQGAGPPQAEQALGNRFPADQSPGGATERTVPSAGALPTPRALHGISFRPVQCNTGPCQSRGTSRSAGACSPSARPSILPASGTCLWFRTRVCLCRHAFSSSFHFGQAPAAVLAAAAAR